MGEKQQRYNPKTGKYETIHQGADVDEDQLQSDVKVGTGRTTDLAAAARGKGTEKTGMPKRADFNSQDEWADAVRKWRGTPETSPQKAALAKKLKEQ